MGRASVQSIGCIVSFFLASSLVVLLLQPVAYAQTPSANLGDGKNLIYGCSPFSGTVHCDPMLNEFDAYKISATAKNVHAVTRSVQDIPFVEGASGKALEFQAYFGEFLNIANAADVNSPQFSISFWVKKDAEFGNYGHILSHFNQEITKGWTFDNGNVTSQSLRFAVFNSNGTMFAPDEVELAQDAFVHVVGTFDGSSVKVYRNGELHGMPAQFNGEYAADPGTAIKVALAAPRTSFPWSGTIDEIRIYNRALGDKEIRELFSSKAGDSSFAGMNNGLVLHLPLDGNIDDASGNGNDAAYMIQAAGMAFSPDGRLFFTEKNTGKIRIMQDDRVLDVPFATVPDLRYDMEQGLLGIALDPEFERNHFVYAYYTASGQENNVTAALPPHNRVVRFTDVNNIGTNATMIIDNIAAHRGGMHAGGALAFGPDGKLYLAVGNAYEMHDAQNATSLLGKMLRINKDGSIPQDNPYPNSPVYTIGHRNAYGIAFNGANGVGIATENGDDNYDEINLLVKGGNYGYPSLQPPNMPPELANDTSVKPIRSYWKTIAPTQATFYEGSKYPELAGKFLVGSYNNGRLYVLNVSDGMVKEEIKIEFPFPGGIIALAQSPSGDIYFGSHYIHKLESLDFENKRATVMPVELDYSSPEESLGVRSVAFSQNDKKIDVSLGWGASTTGAPSFNLEVRIPKALLDGISSVVIGDQNARGNSSQPVDFTLDEGPDHSTVALTRVPLTGVNNSTQISITGSLVPFVGSDFFDRADSN